MPNDSDLNRRDFLKGGLVGAVATAGLSAVPALGLAARPERVLGANDRVRAAVIGVRSRGMAHVHAYSKLKNVEIAAVCDVDDNILRERLADMEKMGIPRPRTYFDIRK